MELFATVQGNTITGIRIALQQFTVLLKYRTIISLVCQILTLFSIHSSLLKIKRHNSKAFIIGKQSDRMDDIKDEKKQYVTMFIKSWG